MEPFFSTNSHLMDRAQRRHQRPCAESCHEVVETTYIARREANGEILDALTPQHRSQLMARVRRKDTASELAVRKLLYVAGYRYRLHVKSLPGHPDIVFPGRAKAILVPGCRWHAHEGCKLFRVSSTRRDYWKSKFAVNRARDARVIENLQSRGWRVLVVWQCETKDRVALRHRLEYFLS